MSPAVARLIVRRLLSLTSNTSTYPLHSYECGLNSKPCARWRSDPCALARGVFLVGAAFRPRQVDPERLGRAERVLVELADLDLFTLLVHDAHIETQRLHLLDEHLERFRDAGLGDVLALDDGLVHLHAAEHVVGLDGEDLLQRVGRAVRLEGPHLHLTEPLTTELRLPTQRLLRDHRVRAGRTGVDLVVHQVRQLQDVHVANGDRTVERLAGTTVEQRHLAVGSDQPGAVGTVGVEVGEQVLDRRDLGTGLVDLVPVRTVEHRRRHPHRGARDRAGLVALRRRLHVLGRPAVTRRVPEVRLEHLADVHTARDTERVEHDVDRRAVGEVRHVLDGEDLGDHTLVAVAAGELVALADLALLTDVDAHELVDARRQLVAVVAGEHAHVDDLAGLAVRHLQARVANLTRLLTEDRAQQALFRRELGLALRRDLADEDVARADLGPHADDPAVVEVFQELFRHVRDVARDLFRTELGVARFDLVLLDVARGQDVVPDE